MRPGFLLSLFALAALAIPQAAQTAPTAEAAPGSSFAGRLDKRLVAEASGIELVIFTPLAAADAPVPLVMGESAFGATTLPWPGARPLPLVLLVSAEGRELALFYDRNRDGKITPDERGNFPAAPENAPSLLEIRLPLEAGPFADYPLLFWPFKGMVKGFDLPANARLFTRSKSAYAQGTVEIEGRPVAVRYVVVPGAALDPRAIEQGVDGDGDGVFGGRETPETDDGNGEEAPVFPVGPLFLSTRSVDVESGRIEMVPRPAADYKRVTLTAGSQMPDFSFADYAGQTHRLSDLRGKHVLIDFWATWCAPCLAELPHLKEAYGAYRDRGLEIVTVAWRDKAEKSAKLVEKEQLPWLQGTAESTEELAAKQLRIQGIPFALLLDPQGRIVSAGAAGQPPLRGKALQETLARLVPEMPGTPETPGTPGTPGTVTGR